jgi:hypothetical protein
VLPKIRGFWGSSDSVKEPVPVCCVHGNDFGGTAQHAGNFLISRHPVSFSKTNPLRGIIKLYRVTDVNELMKFT